MRYELLPASEYISVSFGHEDMKNASLVRKNSEALAPGCICEQVNTSDWESPIGVGAVFDLTCWCETSLLLSFSELIWAEEIMKELNQ